MRPEDGEALGGGSAGVVFAVPSDEGDVALKVFSGRLFRRTRLRLERELDRLSALDGQLLVPDTVVELADGRCALRGELCTGSLADLVAAAGPLSTDDVLVLGTAIASTLATAHEAGIVHGRLTPSNVLFRASGEPVINDFERTLRPVFVRDPRHAREFLAPEGTDSRSSDLYGLGAVLHLALTGEPPGSRPLHREDAPIDLLALVENLLVKDPAARPPDAALVEEILTSLPKVSTVDVDEPVPVASGIEGVPVVTIEPAADTAPEPRKRSLWTAVTAGVVVAAGFTTWALSPGSGDPEPRSLPAPAPLSTPAPPTSASTVKAASQVELATPIDHGSTVDLAWRAPDGYDSAVVVAGETGEAKTTFVRRQRTTTVAVEPGRKYCFLIQITDGEAVRESEPRPIRGATCRR
ncbi:protein kinase domain-containing protein [Amycolatopsis sp. lyj-90]|uniref:protein kinase domain-containing protein n=1 Tax=Amycolatopsis sp. lyj-90 TaxID=2789285 RepID=UPI0039786B3A